MSGATTHGDVLARARQQIERDGFEDYFYAELLNVITIAGEALFGDTFDADAVENMHLSSDYFKNAAEDAAEAMREWAASVPPARAVRVTASGTGPMWCPVWRRFGVSLACHHLRFRGTSRAHASRREIAVILHR